MFYFLLFMFLLFAFFFLPFSFCYLLFAFCFVFSIFILFLKFDFTFIFCFLGYEFGARFLEEFTLNGFNLALHMESLVPETLNGLLKKGVQGLTFMNGSHLDALKRLAANRKRSYGISTFDLIELERGHYVKKEDNSHYDLLDPQLVAIACSSKGQTLADAKGRVLELLVLNLLKDSHFRI
jgi:hypothetical protein